MITQNLSTLKIHKLTQVQYERELEAGRIDENAIYLTPDEGTDLSIYALKEDIPDISNKVDKVEGKGLSTNDYTTAEKNKLAGIEDGAERNVQADWSQNDETASDYVKNRTHYIETPQGKNVLECSIASHFTWGADSSPNLSAHGVSVNMPTVGEIMHAVVTANGISRRFSGTLLKNSFDEMWIGDASKLSGVRYPGNEGEFDFAFVVAPPSYFECYFPVEGFGTIAEGDIVNIHLYTGDPTVIIHQLDEKYIPDTIARTEDVISLPPYTSADEGKILQIVNGKPTWVSLPNAEEATF